MSTLNPDEFDGGLHGYGKGANLRLKSELAAPHCYAAALRPLEARLSEIEKDSITDKNLWHEWTTLKNAIFWTKQAAGWSQHKTSS